MNCHRFFAKGQSEINGAEKPTGLKKHPEDKWKNGNDVFSRQWK